MTQIKGYHKADDSFWRKLEYGRVEIFESSLLQKPILIHRNTFPDYWTSELSQAITLYNNFKMFGLPFDGGWARCPAYMLDCISIVDTILQENKEWLSQKR